MVLDVGSARASMDQRIARPLGLTVEEAAAGIVRVVNATMVKGIRLVSVERGYDPRQFSLVCFGGAGPVHAAMLAEELDIPKLIIPLNPGIACALGLLMADFRHDYVRTLICRLSGVDPEVLNKTYLDLQGQARDQMRRENVPEEDIRLIRTADARYVGQGYTLEVPVAAGTLTTASLSRLVGAYHDAHEDTYGYRMPGDEVEVVNLRVVAVGALSKPAFEKSPVQAQIPATTQKDERPMCFGGRFEAVAAYERDSLRPGNTLEGPCVVEQLDSTTVVPPDWGVVVDEYRNLIVSRRAASRGQKATGLRGDA
jgi:N-methylhydantoinase A